ncbi:hypothetical protein COI95_18090 [Bacillus cereus]|nr:hypothetical protein CN446_07035 [Bacillus cereus]PFJ77202.1 hypothetical protein COI95_18090 [Bacillus cereus]PGU50247.1 hypothetical protein COD70_29695 [Bacillus cereus]
MPFLYLLIFVYFGITGRLQRGFIRAQMILRVCQEVFDLSRKIKFKMHNIQKPLEGRNISSLVLLFGWKTCSYLVRGDASNRCICSPHSCRIKNKSDYHFKNIGRFHQYWKLGRIRAFTIFATMGNSIRASDHILLSKEARAV